MRAAVDVGRDLHDAGRETVDHETPLLVGAGTAAYSSVIVPIVAMVLSTLFEGFVWGPLPAAGAAITLAGMVVAGVGLANAIPQIFAAADRIPPNGPSLSAVFTSLTLAFVIGPPLIGNTADIVGIAGAFTMFAVASVVVVLVAGRVPAAETNPRFRRG